uniref:Putative secreted peptide n=1 Tax=Anopheles braziliensis TaxID=58242 RepID=A0A2M3ZRN0_9DIPT
MISRMLTGRLPIIVLVITLIVSKPAPPLELPFEVDPVPAPLVTVPLLVPPLPVAVVVWKSISRFELGAHMLMQACIMLRLPSVRSSSMANS